MNNNKEFYSEISPLNKYFSRLRGAIKPGAHRMQILFGKEYLAKGIINTPSIIVTGTNGKGSTSALLESSFRYLGYKTGLYTSPHLVYPEERIRINGNCIERGLLEKYVDIAEQLANKNLLDASFFEIATASAFLAFFFEKIDILIAEVGLGGYHDSTNVLAPFLSVITQVGLEHTELLGDTYFKIAQDKAHVARRNSVLIVGQGCNDESMQGIKCTCDKLGATFVLASNLGEKYLNIFNKIKNKNLWLQANSGHILTALKTLEESEIKLNKVFSIEFIELGIENTFWPGRFDVRQCDNKTYIFDAAHNSSGFNYFLMQWEKSIYINADIYIIYASLNDKDWQLIVPKLSKISQNIIFTEVNSERKVKVNELKKFVPLNIRSIETDNIQSALKYVKTCNNINNILVIGSIALLGEVMEYLHINPYKK